MTNSDQSHSTRSGPIAPEGLPYILLFALFSLAIGYVGVRWLGNAGWAVAAIGALLTLWCIWFFRDPDRAIPRDPGCVISPADGVVCLVDQAQPPPELGLKTGPLPRVCVFMNVFNVHVNRAPVAGRVRAIVYRPGKFFNASLDKASADNERSTMAIEMSDGRVVVAVQIAGLVARRIVSRVREGVSLAIGQRYGLIRFGSRVDVYLPVGTTINAKVGQKVIAGESIIARLSSIPAPHATPALAGAEA